MSRKKIRIFSLGTAVLVTVGLAMTATAQELTPDGVLPQTQEPRSRTATLPGEELPVVQRWQPPKLLRTLEGHTAAVDSLVFTQDGQYLISGGSYNDPMLRFWWVETGREIESLRGQRTAVSSLVMSPNGKTLASGGDDGGINLWDWDSEQQIQKHTGTLLDHDSNIMSLAITPDSQLLVSGALDGIRVWNLNNQRPFYVLAGYGNPTYAVTISPNGYVMASADQQGKVRLWHLETGSQISEGQLHSGPINVIAFTKNGRSLITGSYDRTIKVWDVASGQLRYSLRGHGERIRAIAVHPYQNIIASASNDGIRIWNLNSGLLLSHLEHNDWVESLAFSPDGTILASGSYDAKIRLWEIDPFPRERNLVYQAQ